MAENTHDKLTGNNATPFKVHFYNQGPDICEQLYVAKRLCQVNIPLHRQAQYIFLAREIAYQQYHWQV